MKQAALFLVTLLHGKNPRLIDILLVYLVGIGAGMVIVAFQITNNGDLSIVQMIILFIIALDIFGGAISNSTNATNDWYMQQPLWVRLTFLLVHFVHPLVAVVFLDSGNWTFFWFIYLYMLITSISVLLSSKSSNQRPLAMVLYLCGVILTVTVFQPAPILYWFPFVYFLKLIVSFSVDHTDARQPATHEMPTNNAPNSL